MVIFISELRRGRKGFLIWSAAISFMLVICVLMFPEMKGEMESVTDMFANMGGFTQAFGMDRLNFGTLIGFYGIECGNILGIGGGFYAAYLGISMLAKEEHEHTAEFLLTHPVRRIDIMLQKALAVAAQLISLNLIILLLSVVSVLAIGEDLPIKELLLLHGAYLILQLEIALICFGVSAFLRRGSIGIGLGLAAVLYFLNILCNISENAAFLKYITPFAYAEPADILENLSLNTGLILLGCVYAAVAVGVGVFEYTRKDIAA
ncbi:MAG: ABC transporter permease subunit [Clostridiaceae bacterium]|nr:ABC transporter permease subunit [Clostridiaceae bacterium]